MNKMMNDVRDKPDALSRSECHERIALNRETFGTPDFVSGADTFWKIIWFGPDSRTVSNMTGGVLDR